MRLSHLSKLLLLYQITLPTQSFQPNTRLSNKRTSLLMSSSAKTWSDLRTLSTTESKTGKALEADLHFRTNGYGPANVHNQLRLFSSSSEEKPKITLYRDHAGWCPYCEKTMLLVEEKEIPINIELINMRSYGDKPREFLQMVPGGLLPAITVEKEGGRKAVITESQVIMELLDDWFPPEDGYKGMMPKGEGMRRYDALAKLERELFSWWCTFMFRPEGGPLGGGFGGVLKSLKGDDKKEMSASMKGFMECLGKVDAELRSTPGPWFFDSDHPMMIDFIYVSHVERMLASCAYWKGLLIRNEFPGISAWMDAFDKRESYLAFKSDFYTNVMDIPPQYGPAFFGGVDEDVQKQFADQISGRDGKSWHLPLSHDDPLQPLYKGPPLPSCVLEATGLQDYANADPSDMATACRHHAAWKLALNAEKISRFASRGSSKGALNQRRQFAAELADPYAEPDEAIVPTVDAVLRIVCEALLSEDDNLDGMRSKLQSTVKKNEKDDVIGSLKYLRDRVGVPRDMPLAAARQLRAYLNWAIDSI